MERRWGLPEVDRTVMQADVTLRRPWDFKLPRLLSPAIPGEESRRVLPGSLVRGQLQFGGSQSGGEGVRPVWQACTGSAQHRRRSRPGLQARATPGGSECCQRSRCCRIRRRRHRDTETAPLGPGNPGGDRASRRSLEAGGPRPETTAALAGRCGNFESRLTAACYIWRCRRPPPRARLPKV